MNSFKPMKPQGAVDIKFTDNLLPVFVKYIADPKEETLYKICPMQVAHTIDVIFQRSLVLYDNLYCKLTDPIDRAMCVFFTPYEMFDINKVFFGKDIDWHFPFSVEPDNKESNFDIHNFFYFRGYERLDERGLLSNFYQDIDIMSNLDNWKLDLLKALYRVVMGAFSAWKTWSITHPKNKRR